MISSLNIKERLSSNNYDPLNGNIKSETSFNIDNIDCNFKPDKINSSISLIYKKSITKDLTFTPQISKYATNKNWTWQSFTSKINKKRSSIIQEYVNPNILVNDYKFFPEINDNSIRILIDNG